MVYLALHRTIEPLRVFSNLKSNLLIQVHPQDVYSAVVYEHEHMQFMQVIPGHTLRHTWLCRLAGRNLRKEYATIGVF